jgi:hypothetical protein
VCDLRRTRPLCGLKFNDARVMLDIGQMPEGAEIRFVQWCHAMLHLFRNPL